MPTSRSEMKRRRVGALLAGMCLLAAVPTAAQPGQLSDPFPGRRDVELRELLAVLAAEVPVLARATPVRRDFERLFPDAVQRADEALYLDYVRVRLAFEATRAGGLWGIAWRITDQLPQSDRIWAQWRAVSLRDADPLPTVTAIAECDELSALFAFTTRGLGLSRRSHAGLLWPTSNHTVAVWVVGSGPRARRIVVPTSQIFLDAAQSLDTSDFDPWKQKAIYDYSRADAAPGTLLPAALARHFVQAVQRYAALSQAELQAMRNQREARQWAQLQSRGGP